MWEKFKISKDLLKREMAQPFPVTKESGLAKKVTVPSGRGCLVWISYSAHHNVVGGLEKDSISSSICEVKQQQDIGFMEGVGRSLLIMSTFSPRRPFLSESVQVSISALHDRKWTKGCYFEWLYR